MKYIWRFHDWYDRQPELQRFLMMLLIASPMIMMNLWVDSLPKALALVAYIGVVLGPRIYRADHTRPRRRQR